MKHIGKFEPNRYYDAQKWGEETARWVDDLLGFTLTNEQKNEISKAMANWFGDIVRDEREDICAELQNEAAKAGGSTERSVCLAIVESLKSRGRK